MYSEPWSSWKSIQSEGVRRTVERDAADLLYRYSIGSILVSVIASSGLSLISLGQVTFRLIAVWWVSMSLVLVLRGFDILRYYRLRRLTIGSGMQDIRRFGFGLIATAVLWAAFPLTLLKDLNQTGRAYTVIVLCGMAGGSATVLAPSNTLSAVFCALLVLPTSILFLRFPGSENTFLGVLGCVFFVVLLISSRVSNRATMAAIRLSRFNEALIAEVREERCRTEAVNTELRDAQAALTESNYSLEHRVKARTADLDREIKEKERFSKELAYQASRDSLTGLSNRASLSKRLRDAIARAERANAPLAVLFLDLDRFKKVNDNFGHSTGDHVLKAVAGRLSRHLDAGMELARWGGDEFVVVVSGFSLTDEVFVIANLISEVLSDPVAIEAGSVRIEAHIGIALFPEHGRSEEDLIRAADGAMYASKQNGSSSVRLFDPALGQLLAERRLLERALNEALDTGALSVAYQPIITTSAGLCESVEALIRWDHPQHGSISPVQLIPIAERTGEIIALGRWVLDQACREAASWQGDSPPCVSVNVSPIQIEGGTLIADVLHALESARLPSFRLHLELTESVFAGDRCNIIPTLAQLREMGVTISLDDFGTGFSCLADLRRLPIDRIKIDKSFVESLDTDSAPIVRVIVSTAHNFGLTVVAEGVETKAQAECLANLGVHYLQGYLFSKALAPEEFRTWLNRYQPVAKKVAVGSL